MKSDNSVISFPESGSIQLETASQHANPISMSSSRAAITQCQILSCLTPSVIRRVPAIVFGSLSIFQSIFTHRLICRTCLENYLFTAHFLCEWTLRSKKSWREVVTVDLSVSFIVLGSENVLDIIRSFFFYRASVMYLTNKNFAFESNQIGN